MTRRCCMAAAPPRPFARLTASILPAAAAAFLPKCPLCLAAWLTVATGIGFSPAVTAWLRAAMILFSAGLIALMIGRRAFRRTPSHLL